MTTAARTQRAALACVLPGPRGGEVVGRALSALTPADLPAAVTTFTTHGAWGHLAWHAHELGAAVPEPLRREAGLRHAAMVDQHLRALSDLAVVLEVLDAAGARWLTFKGPVLAERAYPRPDLRGYGDLDLLVHPDDLGAATGALAGAGMRVLDHPGDLRRRPPVGEIHLVGPAGTPVDLHWHLLYHPRQQQRTAVDPRAVTTSAVRVPVGRLLAPTMAAPAHLVYVCAHAAASGADRLRWLVDVAHLSRTEGLDWGQVVATARAWRLARATALVLRRSRSLVGADVPTTVLRDLDGSRSWATAQRVAAVVDPVAGRRWVPVTSGLARSSDDDLRRTWNGVAAGLGRRAGGAGRPPRSVVERVDLGASPDGPAVLQAYLDAVAAWRPGT